MTLYEELSREEFKDMINWELWDKLVDRTKKEIEEILREANAPKKRKMAFKCYAYDSNGNLAYKWETQRDLYNHFPDACTGTLNNYLNHDWIYDNLMLSRVEYSQDVAFAMYRYAIEHGRIYKKDLTRTRAKPVYCYNEQGKLVGLYESCYRWARCNGLGYYGGQLRNGDIIKIKSLVSNNFYDEETAREKYKELKK